jgi:hypothetical protein
LRDLNFYFLQTFTHVLRKIRSSTTRRPTGKPTSSLHPAMFMSIFFRRFRMNLLFSKYVSEIQNHIYFIGRIVNPLKSIFSILHLPDDFIVLQIAPFMPEGHGHKPDGAAF